MRKDESFLVFLKVSTQAKINFHAKGLQHKSVRFTFLKTCGRKAFMSLAKNKGFPRTMSKPKSKFVILFIFSHRFTYLLAIVLNVNFILLYP